LSADTRDAIKLAVGIIATMSALILGLLVSSAKTSFDTSAAEISQLSADLILLDRQLVHYGPGAKDIRDVCGAMSSTRSTPPGEGKRLPRRTLAAGSS
jgi:hypothetical protein